MKSRPCRRRVEPTDEWEQIELLRGWPEQRDYGLARSLVLFGASADGASRETGVSSGRMLRRKAARFEAGGRESLFGSEALLRGAGRRMAEARGVPVGGVPARLEAAVGVLNELGGLAEIEERDGGLVIRGYGCPLAAATQDHPGVCRMVETLITEVVVVPVPERCHRGERPRCCFEIASAGDATQK